MLSSGQRFRCVRTAFALCTNRCYTQKRVVDRYARSGGSGQDKIKIDPNNVTHFERRLFVSNIAQEVTWKELKDHFRGVGATFVSLSKDQVTGQSKGCGIVQFDDPTLIDHAVEKMNGTELMGRCLVVRRDKKSNAPGRRYGSSLGHALGNPRSYNSNNTQQTATSAVQEHHSDDYWNEVHDKRPQQRPSVPRMNNNHKADLPQEVAHGQAQVVRKTSNKSNAGTTRDPRDEIYVAPTELQRIEALLQKRDEHRANQNYEFADALQVTLRNKHRVHCEDADGLWRILAPVTSKGAIRKDNMRTR